MEAIEKVAPSGFVIWQQLRRATIGETCRVGLGVVLVSRMQMTRVRFLVLLCAAAAVFRGTGKLFTFAGRCPFLDANSRKPYNVLIEPSRVFYSLLSWLQF